VRKRLSEGAWARWGLLASAFALGAILIIASWSNYRSAHSATNTLYVGQARILEREIMSVLRHGMMFGESEDPQAALDSLLSAQAQTGLRYVALFGEAGALEASAGEPTPAAIEVPVEPGDEERGFQMSKIGSRVRMSLGRPPMAAMPPLPPMFEPGRPHHPRHSSIVFEFEPLVASRLTDRATGLLAFGLAAAAAMMLVAAVSYAMSRRYESAKRVFEEKQRLSLVGEMSAVLAHEIRNPLASLKGHAQLLSEHLPATSADRTKADRVVLEASRLEALTSDLLDFVRTGPLDRVPTDPAGLVRLSVEDVAPDGFTLRLEHAPERWPLDGARIRQVLTNLLRNAHQATPAGAPRPEVELHVEDGRLIMRIRDHGQGLPKGQEKRIFDPFFTTRTSGTGLGLAVARRIVELHGGELTAECHAEGGAVFSIVLPGEKG
jgi:two-component system sensor histidine kinase HydH